MSRSIPLIIAASLILAGGNSANLLAQQDAATTSPAGNDVATLQAENAMLRKQVADATHTIAQLQAQLAKAGIHHQDATASAETPPVAAVPAQTPDTTAAPTGPQRALPLDSTNAVVNPAAPGAPATDAGPSRSYTVVKGDSLWKIAHKMYPGDTKNGVDKIQEANKDAINGKPLKIGQVLIIPQ